jgi:two-component system chemotaxis response regulator CheY
MWDKKKLKLGPLTTLVVDDNHHMCDIVRLVLTGFGVGHVHTATDVEHAFDLFRREPVDIIVTDLHMMPLSGLDLVELVRNAADSPNPFVPVIMLTAYTELSRVLEARDAGVNEIIRKPIVPIELYRKFVAVIDHPRPFVRTPGFFGPDRRRLNDPRYKGPERRQNAETIPLTVPEEERILIDIDDDQEMDTGGNATGAAAT